MLVFFLVISSLCNAGKSHGGVIKTVIILYMFSTVLAAVIVIYIINERGNPAFNMTWVLLILIFPAFGCLFYIWVKSQLGTRYIGKRLCMLRLDTAKIYAAGASGD